VIGSASPSRDGTVRRDHVTDRYCEKQATKTLSSTIYCKVSYVALRETFVSSTDNVISSHILVQIFLWYYGSTIQFPGKDIYYNRGP
jgi:hypothetical protein